MDNTTLRGILVSGLADYMRGLPEAFARTLANELTCEISTYIAGERGLRHQLPCFPPETWNRLTVGVPWEAFNLAHGSLNAYGVTSVVKALCSAPAHLDSLLALQAGNSGLWGGSLLVALGKILGEVKHDLVIFSPYWRTDGVHSLLAAAGRMRYCGVQVFVLTQPKHRMKPNDKEGLIFFIDSMKSSGASVLVMAPSAYEGQIPILHAKLIIADGKIGYVGSANITKSGLDHSLEAGVLAEGEIANAFSLWAKAIAATSDPW
jgi:phosphatidylserine/phosphatidylglycerophosphate/cardiolipin synthase-like enzyme